MADILDLPEVRERVTRWSVEDYEHLTELGVLSKRAELLRGLIVEKMSKSPLHNFLVNRIFKDLLRRVNPGFAVRPNSSLRLRDSIPEPDITVVRGQEEDFRARHPTTAELVIEVAVSSVALDREVASLYAEAGVSEYWIVLGEAKQVEVYCHLENGIYQDRQVYSCGEVIPYPYLVVADGSVSVAAWFE